MTFEQMPRDRQPALNIPTSILAVLVLCIGIHFGREYLLGRESDLYVLFYGSFIPARYAESLSWEALTSPVTYSLLHGSVGHLLNNAVWLVAFGSPVAKSRHDGGCSSVRFPSEGRSRCRQADHFAAADHFPGTIAYRLDLPRVLFADQCRNRCFWWIVRFGNRQHSLAGAYRRADCRFPVTANFSRPTGTLNTSAFSLEL
jgi:Rhomboid family